MTAPLREDDRKRSRLELLYHVGRELSSRLDLSDLLRRILVLTTESIGATSGSIVALGADGRVMDAALIYDGHIHDNAAARLASTAEHGLAGWIMRAAQPALIPDTDRDERWLKRDDDLEDARPKSAIGVPLQSRNGVVGALTLVHTTPAYFDDDDLSLATAIADQAAIAVENARLFEALRRQSALYETLLKAQSDVGEGFAIIDPQTQRAVYVNDAFTQIMGYSRAEMMAFPSVLNMAVEEERAILTDRLRRRLAGESVETHYETAFYHKNGQRVELDVAVKPFRVGERSQLVVIARDISDRKRTAETLTDEKRRLELLYELSQRLAASLNPREVAETAVARICSALGLFKGTVMVTERGSDRLRLLVVSGWSPEEVAAYDRQLNVRLGDGLAGWVAAQRQVAIVDDVARDSHWKTVPGLDDWVRSTIAIPLVAGDTLTGVLGLHSDRPGAFGPEQVPFLTAAAAPLAAALQNARLFQESQRQTRELSALYDTALAIGSVLETRALLERLHEHVRQLIPADTFAVAFYHADRREFEVALAVEGGESVPSAIGMRVPLSEGGLTGWVVEHRQSLLVGDLQSDPLPVAPRHITQPARAWLGVPLLARDRIIGAVSVQSFRPRAFGDEDRRFLEALGGQVAIALENARLFEAEQKRLQIASTLQEVARIINATLDPNQVFPLVLEQLERVIRYDSSSVMLREGDRLKVVAARGFRDLDAILGFSVNAEQAVCAQVLRERRPLAIDDVHRLDHWAHSDNPESMAIRGWIGAPLVVKDEVVGLITVDSHRPGAYGEADARLVGAFADQVATAVVNARLFAESQRQMHAMASLAESARAVTSTLDLEEVLRRLLNRTVSTLEVEAASIALVDHANGWLEFKVAEGKGAREVTGMQLRLGQGIAGWVAQHGRPVLVPEARGDPRFYPDVDRQTGFTTRSIACVPIVVQGKVLGIIEALNPLKGSFDRESLQLLGNLAALAGSAISHAQLFRDTQAAESRYAGLFEDSINPIIITDPTGTITEANRKACKFLGYDKDQIIGLKVDAIHRMGTGLLGAERFRHVQAGDELSFETKAITRDGRELPVEVHAKQIVRGGQGFIQWIEHDISERLALDEIRSDLTSMIFHDLRSPLGNIISSLDVLKASLPADDEALQSVLAIAIRSSQRLSRLVDSLLDLRRLEAGQAILQREPASLTALVAEAAEQIHPIAESKGISLRFDFPPQLPSVNVDGDMIRRVIINLMENGVKYTPGEGVITVSVRADGKEARISIRDTGPGIPPSEHQRIFQRFARVQRKGAPKGLGLGLAFCKLAVEAHGGRIWVESQPGQGATFTFSLPL